MNPMEVRQQHKFRLSVEEPVLETGEGDIGPEVEER